MAGGGVKINNIKVVGGADGATYIPLVEDGWISWENDKGYPNPNPVYINGEDGQDGQDGATGAKLVSQILQGQDASGGNIYKQTFDDGTTAYFTAPKGDKGDQGETPSHYGASLSLVIDLDNFSITAQLKDQNGEDLGLPQTIYLPMCNDTTDIDYIMGGE